MDLDEDAAVIPSASNLSSSWWIQVAQEINTALPFDSSDGGLWSGSFVPPPPRPIFIDDNIATDGLTTCDLCTWAWKNSNSFSLDAALEAPGDIGWVLTMVIVSFISAVIGAVVMIIVIHCRRRMKNTGLNETQDSVTSTSPQIQQSITIPNDKLPQGPYASESNNGVWSWLSRRSTSIPPHLPHVENHYTHMEESYGSNGGEALYAELDRESSLDRAYQNSAYTDTDAQPSSPPSSAYYSDLSVNAAATPLDRAYEVVGLATLPVWDSTNDGVNRRTGIGRLAAITETTSVPSDYV